MNNLKPFKPATDPPGFNFKTRPAARGGGRGLILKGYYAPPRGSRGRVLILKGLQRTRWGPTGWTFPILWHAIKRPPRPARSTPEDPRDLRLVLTLTRGTSAVLSRPAMQWPLCSPTRLGRPRRRGFVPLETGKLFRPTRSSDHGPFYLPFRGRVEHVAGWDDTGSCGRASLPPGVGPRRIRREF